MCSKDIYTRHNWCVKSPPYAVVQMIGYKRSRKMEIKIATLNSHCPIIIIINPRQILRLADNTTCIPGFWAASFIFCVLFYYYLRGLNKSGAGSFFFKKFYRLINFSSHYVRGIWWPMNIVSPLFNSGDSYYLRGFSLRSFWIFVRDFIHP